MLKNILRAQHKYLPIPLFIYKYFFKYKFFLKLSLKYGKLCYDTDFKTYGGSSRSLQNYWNSKRSLYWHYMWLYFNRFDKLFFEIYKKYPKIFKDLRVCDLMTGIGAPYLLNEFKQEITMIEVNKHCCYFLKKNFPQNEIINESWQHLEKISNEIDTLILLSGCLILLDKNEIETFFNITKNIKNFVIINDGADEDFFAQNGTNHYDIKTRLEKYNNNFKDSNIFIERKKDSKMYLKFLMINKMYLN